MADLTFKLELDYEPSGSKRAREWDGGCGCCQDYKPLTPKRARQILEQTEDFVHELIEWLRENE